MQSFIPKGYASELDLYETQSAISLIKRTFQDTLSTILNLKRVSAPLFVEPGVGLNDNLNGVERPVSFDVPFTGGNAEIVQSLAKWKRYALYKYKFFPGNGLYTDMNAIRRDEELDNLHSVYVDQWDWEKVITRDQRTSEYLHDIVTKIVRCICHTSDVIKAKHPELNLPELERNITFIKSSELLDMYPDKTPQEREYLFTKEHKTVFIEQVGGALRDGRPHDKRSPDYDDWSLNGDILFYYPILDCVLEISSMGVRVDKDTLARQLEISGCRDRAGLMYHKMVAEEILPLTIGGGIGQSRLCMLLLGKAHIGEVQASVWDENTRKMCENAGVTLL